MRVTKETCKLAKQKGYKQCSCNAGYPNCVCGDECWFAEQHELQKWLRDEHCFHIELHSPFDGAFVWIYSIYSIPEFSNCNSIDDRYATYEEALEEGINEALLMLKDI